MHLLIPGQATRTAGCLQSRRQTSTLKVSGGSGESADPPFLSTLPNAPLSRLRPPCFCSLVPLYKFPFKLPHKQLESQKKKLSRQHKPEQRNENTTRNAKQIKHIYHISHWNDGTFFDLLCNGSFFFLFFFLKLQSIKKTAFPMVFFSALRWQHLTDQTFSCPAHFAATKPPLLLAERLQAPCKCFIFLYNTAVISSPSLFLQNVLRVSPRSVFALSSSPSSSSPPTQTAIGEPVGLPHLSVAPSLLPRHFTHLSRCSALLSAQTDCSLYSRQPEGPTFFSLQLEEE